MSFTDLGRTAPCWAALATEVQRKIRPRRTNVEYRRMSGSSFVTTSPWFSCRNAPKVAAWPHGEQPATGAARGSSLVSFSQSTDAREHIGIGIASSLNGSESMLARLLQCLWLV